MNVTWLLGRMKSQQVSSWVSAISSTGLLIVAIVAAMFAAKELDVPEPPSWICVHNKTIQWEDLSHEPMVKGYTVMRSWGAGSGDVHEVSFVPADSPQYRVNPDGRPVIDRSPLQPRELWCGDTCTYRIATVSLSGRRSRTSEPVTCTESANPNGTANWTCDAPDRCSRS